MREFIYLAVVYNGNLLVIRRRGQWSLPGRRKRVGESGIDCIFDEIIKEVPGLELKDLRPLGKFKGRNFFQWSPLRDKVYLARVKKQFFNNCLKNDNQMEWIKDLNGKSKISKPTRRIFWILKNEGCL